ncbi:MAG: DNA mismatch repair endonuclease MutL [Lachnospiraceae bacterium]|nr:DNA mismatch repair endonuclease MutL [Lachnospiraceae bacterium]
MNRISLLSQDTIDKIAAGEVVERPASVVKELVENAVDAGANAVTVEIKEGGISLIRITDNGCGIPKDEVRSAFLRHATSKIRTVDDLQTAGTLGFRGEALSSVAAVCQVEMITKTPGSLLGVRYCIEGGVEQSLEEIGAPEGTTLLVRNLFYHTPARRKFLKSATTEAGYVSDLMERLALSHPNIAFKFINNQDTKLHTSGNGKMKDIIYGVYGREIAANVVQIDSEDASKDEEQGMHIGGFIGKPSISRGNRNYENYFVNGRYVRSAIIARAIEDAYKPFLMNHRYPLTVLMLDVDPEQVDVNVHPTKMEVRFANQQMIYDRVYNAVKDGLVQRELIPEFTIAEQTKGKDRRDAAPEIFEKRKEKSPVRYPEPFEKVRSQLLAESTSPYEPKYPDHQRGGASSAASASREAVLKPVSGVIIRPEEPAAQEQTRAMPSCQRPEPESLQNQEPDKSDKDFMQSQRPRLADGHSHFPGETPAERQREGVTSAVSANYEAVAEGQTRAGLADGQPRPSDEISAEYSRVSDTPVQMELFDEKLLSEQNVKRHKLIGQIFDTYWIVEFQDKMYIIDQHAAHEKVLYERFMKNLAEKKQTSQMIAPPIIVSLSMAEEELLKKHMDRFTEVGFEIEPFGGREYSIRAVPGNLYSIASETLFTEMLDGLNDLTERVSDESIRERIASMSCKAAVKGNHRLSVQEVDALITELLTLENPYNCPHGRPTIVAMTKYELEKKFKRVL